MKKLLLSISVIAMAFSLNAQNLLVDGGFDTDGALPEGGSAEAWGMWSGNGGTVEVIDGVAVCTPGAADEASPWNLQVEQFDAAVENDLTYTLKFTAYEA